MKFAVEEDQRVGRKSVNSHQNCQKMYSEKKKRKQRSKSKKKIDVVVTKIISETNIKLFSKL